ncbi:MAG: hypothetical protein IJ191_03500 [Treponema sp.]|nr:hypothetical protein [Treponema sp.]
MRKTSAIVFSVAMGAVMVMRAVAGFAVEPAVAAANRRTATRYLQRAEHAFASSDWDTASEQATLGAQYDDTVADLQYIIATADYRRGVPRAHVIRQMENVLAPNMQWVGYNRDGARILYADLLADTGRYEDALRVLDEAPFLYSADAEFIRIKVYYCMRTPESIARARDKVTAARRIYQSDMRFPRIFFMHEHALQQLGDADRDGERVQRIADTFIARLPLYDAPDAELEIYAALFASGERQRRLLEAFAAHGQRHPRYAAAALQAGILSEQAALTYFFACSAGRVHFSELREFVPLLTDADVQAALVAILTAYEGELLLSADGAVEPDMRVTYVRGRPETITWDRERDGIVDWTITCDFGVPVLANGGQTFSLTYGVYPAVATATLADDVYSGSYRYADESFFWTPCQLSVPDVLTPLAGCQFFVPVPLVDERFPTPELLITAASYYDTAVPERRDARASFALLDGVPVTADYRVGEHRYARAVFEQGIPVTRAVDNDGDGIYEVTEVFGFDPHNDLQQPDEERAALRERCFPIPGFPSGVYVSLVQIDTNGDAVPDFTEEYGMRGARTVSWDTDADGAWNIQYRRYPQETGAAVQEEARFYTVPDAVLVTVTSVRGVPIRVVRGDVLYDVVPGTTADFYWIGEAATAATEAAVRDRITESGRQGVSLIYEGEGGVRILAVRVGAMLFAEQIVELSDAADGAVFGAATDGAVAE